MQVKSKLCDFIEMDQSEWLVGAKVRELESMLAHQFMIQLFKQSFHKVEADIFQQRISRLYEVNKFTFVFCV